ncbi:MAG TPA: hypothetical protein VFJ93_07715 [Gaiellaceae bacterium]|nr:hypothetical protein [Gaiellaceae bacterium]
MTHDHRLDVSPSERVHQLVGVVIATAVVLGFIFAPLVLAALIFAAFGWAA